MLHLTALAMVTALAAAPAASPAPSVSAPTVTRTTEVTGAAHVSAPKRPNLELPAWTRYLTIEQQNDAMHAELDREFNVDHSP
jgi:hypothetical protein